MNPVPSGSMHMTGARPLCLDGRTALVTGSSRNLGAAIVADLARHGATVAVTFQESRSAAERIVSELCAETERAHVAIRSDLSTADGVRSVVAEASERLGGGVDILVNNLGGWAGGAFASLPDADWDMVLHSNLKSAFVACQEVGPGMKHRGWGRIINISAASAYVRSHSVYGLAKASLQFLTEALAVEMAPEITVNAIAPGQIAESADEAEAAMPGFVAEVLSQTPAGRLVHRSEIAALVSELCSATFDLVTGATIPVDGGWRFHTP